MGAENVLVVEDDANLRRATAAVLESAGFRVFQPECVAVTFQLFQSESPDLVAGRAYPVSVTMTNVGNTTWSRREGYVLGARKPEGDARWGMQHLELREGQTIAPGELATYAFTVTAPAEPGRYDFQWRMCVLGVRWFGLYTPLVQVTVAAGKAGASPR